ncbi:MAG: hypothetical protein M3033_12710 [Acidobacteriota bacterium]|nr:hypothetical protein [Acidobacteriota bacterium]
MKGEDYAGLIYVLSSMASVLIFSASFVIYLMYKQINVYLVAVGLLMLLTGFVTKKFIGEV